MVAGHVARPQIEQVAAFQIQSGNQRAVLGVFDAGYFRQDVNPVGDFAVEVQAVEEGFTFHVAVGQFVADRADEVILTEAIPGGQEEVPNAVAVALEDVRAAVRPFVKKSAGQQKAVAFVANDHVFQPGADVGPTGFVREGHRDENRCSRRDWQLESSVRSKPP